jgi:hypothetical protein
VGLRRLLLSVGDGGLMCWWVGLVDERDADQSFFNSQLENNSEPAQSEQGVRKVLYQRVSSFFSTRFEQTLTLTILQIVAAFPEGWMNSGNISRESKWHMEADSWRLIHRG